MEEKGSDRADYEKVIADLRGFINYPEPLSGTVKDALELLKEQEAVSPNITTNVNGIYYVCGNCGEMMFGYKYCPNCGRRVKWGGKVD